MMKGLRLYKKEKLRGEIAIGALFPRPGSPEADAVGKAIAFPVRAVWRLNGRSSSDCPRFLVMVPKRRLRHAVDRVRMRRLIREAYRLNRDLIPRDAKLDVAFVYVDSSLRPYAEIEASMRRLLKKISENVAARETAD